MTTYKLLLLPGDGIGPEVMAEVSRVPSPGSSSSLTSRDTMGKEECALKGK